MSSRTSDFEASSINKLIKTTMSDFVLKDIPEELGAFVRGAKNMGLGIWSAGVSVKSIKSLKEVKIGSMQALRRVATLPSKAVKAVKVTSTQLSTDLTCMSKVEKQVYVGALALYAVSLVSSISVGNSLPDKDISTLGIGAHRNAAFHSVLTALVARLIIRFIERVVTSLEEGGHLDATPELAVVKRCLSLSRGGVAIGVAAHLFVDGTIESSKAVLFGTEVGSLVGGSLYDDKAWLLINGFLASMVASSDDGAGLRSTL